MLNVTLWALQVLMALIFLAHGWIMLVPPASLIEQMNASLSPALRIFIGVSEVAAAAGLILPALTRILPWLVPLAAAGLSIVMVCATVWHVVRNEISSSVTTFVLLGLLAFLTYMRWKVKPIAARNASGRLGSQTHVRTS